MPKKTINLTFFSSPVITYLLVIDFSWLFWMSLWSSWPWWFSLELWLLLIYIFYRFSQDKSDKRHTAIILLLIATLIGGFSWLIKK